MVSTPQKVGEINKYISTPEPSNSNNLTLANQQRQQTQEDSRPRVQHINIQNNLTTPTANTSDTKDLPSMITPNNQFAHDVINLIIP